MANASLGPKQIDFIYLGAVSVGLDHRIKGARQSSHTWNILQCWSIGKYLAVGAVFDT